MLEQVLNISWNTKMFSLWKIMRTSPLFGAFTSKSEAQKIQMENKLHNNCTIKQNPDIYRRYIFPLYVWKTSWQWESNHVRKCRVREEKTLHWVHIPRPKGGRNGNQQLKNIIYHRGANFVLTPCFALLWLCHDPSAFIPSEISEPRVSG